MGSVTIEQVIDRYSVEKIVRFKYEGLAGKAGSPDVVGELVSDVHWRLMKHGPFDAYASAQSWLYSVAHSVIIDYWRKEGTRQRSVLSYDAGHDTQDSDGVEVGEYRPENERFGYNPHTQTEDHIALSQLVEVARRTPGVGTPGAETLGYVAAMIEAGSTPYDISVGALWPDGGGHNKCATRRAKGRMAQAGRKEDWLG